jgi:hypothetical protein
MCDARQIFVTHFPSARLTVPQEQQAVRLTHAGADLGRHVKSIQKDFEGTITQGRPDHPSAYSLKGQSID